MKTLHTIYTSFAKRLVMVLIILTTIGIGSAWGEDYELVTTITDGEYVIGAVKGSAGNNTTIYAINSTDGTSWKSATEKTPSNGKISNPASSIVWTLTKTGDNSFTLKNGSIYLTIATTTGSGSVRSNSTSAGTIYFASTGSNSTFEISGVSTFTVSSGNQVGYNIGSGYRQYAQRNHSTATNSGSISTQFRFYKKTASTFTVTCQSNNSSYGTVSQPSVTNVANNTAISANGNTLTVGTTTVTATPNEQDADYTYDFEEWSGIPTGGKVTENVTVTANFTRTARALTNYRTTCSAQPSDCSKLQFTTNITENYTANYAQDAEATPLTISAQYDNSANGVTYQWYSNVTNPTTDGTLISDATSASYTPLTTTTGTTYYYCVATYDEECTIASNVATVTITAPVPTFTVTFDSDGGSAVEQQTIEDGETATEPADPTKTGHTFGGWYKGDTKFDFTTPITSNITLKAKWTIDSYTLTWNVNGGDDLTSTYTSGSVEYGTAITQPDDPTREGYRFSGWHDGTDIVTPATTMPAENLTYTAQWKKEHTIKWIVNGDTDTPYETTYVVDGDALVLPSNPDAPSTCKEKVFIGWTESASVNADGSDIEYVDEKTKPNTDKNYYAVFASPDANGAGGDYKKVISELSDWSGEYLIVYETSETTGVAFDGSLDDLDNTSNDTKLVGIENESIASTEETNVINFTIGKIENSSNYYIKSASGKYIGRTADSNGMNISSSDKYPHQISFGDPDWSISVGEIIMLQSVINSSIVGTPMLLYMSGTGSRFRYYDSAQEPIALYRKSSYTDYTTTCVETFKVTYKANGATSGDVPVDENNYISGATVTVLGNTGNLQKTHYSFVGWNTQADGNGTSYQAGITFTITEDVTLYAIWEELPQYSVTWYVNGKQLTDIELSGASTTVYEGDRITKTPPAPNPEDFCGQVFAGWTDVEMDVNDTNKPTIYNLVDEFPTASADQTFYAVFADYEN